MANPLYVRDGNRFYCSHGILLHGGACLRCEKGDLAKPRKYRPSNATEGDAFENRFCRDCIHDKDNECQILAAVYALDVNDPEYPKDWVYDGRGPRCNNFQHGDGEPPFDPNAAIGSLL